MIGVSWTGPSEQDWQRMHSRAERQITDELMMTLERERSAMEADVRNQRGIPRHTGALARGLRVHIERARSRDNIATIRVTSDQYYSRFVSGRLVRGINKAIRGKSLPRFRRQVGR